MPVCACCGQTRDTYGDMVDHTFFVCLDCVRRDRTLRPLAYGVMGAGVLLLFVLSATLHQGWLHLAAQWARGVLQVG